MSKFKVGDIVSPNVVEYWTKDWPKAEVVGFDGLWPKIQRQDGLMGYIFNESTWDVVEPKKEEQLAPKFKVGDRVVCEDWSNPSGRGYLIKQVNSDHYRIASSKDDNDVSPMDYTFEEWDGKLELVEPKKEDEMQKIEVGSKWIFVEGDDSEDEIVATVVHVSTGKSPHVFYEFTDGSGDTAEVDDFLRMYKPFIEKKTITQWTYVYRDEYGEVLMDCELYDSEDEAAKAVRHDTHGRGTLIKTLKIEYTEE